MPGGQHLLTSLLLFPGSSIPCLAFHCRSAIFRATTVALQLILNQLLAHRVGNLAFQREDLQAIERICCGNSNSRECLEATYGAIH